MTTVGIVHAFLSADETDLVDAPRHETASIHDAGAAYAFERDGETWIERERYSAAEPTEDSGFGAALALGAEFGAVGEPGIAHVAEKNPGAVDLF